ncbi:MAG: hypothetical protein NC117_05420 [Pseudoflavonifractor sp.]|nr:hypothetical protein [Pseudoflavonifractor sp.]
MINKVRSPRVVLLALLLGLLSVYAAGVSAQIIYQPGRENRTSNVEFAVDNIDYRQDLTRVYGRLLGRPHTSCRVDNITLSSGEVDYTATDIDGIDFKRWFQWEDDGSIAVEIDFPRMKRRDTFTITISTPRGVRTFHIKR